MEWAKIKNEKGEITNLPGYDVPVVLWDNKGKRWVLGSRVLNDDGNDVWNVFPGNFLIPINAALYYNSIVIFEVTHFSNLSIPKDVLS